jgi:hypothetical protein
MPTPPYSSDRIEGKTGGIFGDGYMRQQSRSSQAGFKGLEQVPAARATQHRTDVPDGHELPDWRRVWRTRDPAVLFGIGIVTASAPFPCA